MASIFDHPHFDHRLTTIIQQPEDRTWKTYHGQSTMTRRSIRNIRKWKHPRRLPSEPQTFSLRLSARRTKSTCTTMARSTNITPTFSRATWRCRTSAVVQTMARQLKPPWRWRVRAVQHVQKMCGSFWRGGHVPPCGRPERLSARTGCQCRFCLQRTNRNSHQKTDMIAKWHKRAVNTGSGTGDPQAAAEENDAMVYPIGDGSTISVP